MAQNSALTASNDQARPSQELRDMSTTLPEGSCLQCPVVSKCKATQLTAPASPVTIISLQPSKYTQVSRLTALLGEMATAKGTSEP